MCLCYVCWFCVWCVMRSVVCVCVCVCVCVMCIDSVCGVLYVYVRFRVYVCLFVCSCVGVYVRVLAFVCVSDLCVRQKASNET